MGCGRGCLKLVLTIINVIFFLAGGAILAVGLFVRFEPSVNKYVEANGFNVLTEELYTAAYILIAVGAFTFIVGFLGCCGAMKDNKCLIAVYVVLVLMILGAEIGGGVYVYVNKEKYTKEIEDSAYKYLSGDYANNKTRPSDLGWDTAMKNMECCGVNGTRDFDGSEFSNRNRDGHMVPVSCCKTIDDGDDKKKYKNEDKCQADAKNNVTTSDYLNTKGCKQAIEDLLVKYSTLLLGVSIGVAVFEVSVVIMGIAFACSDKD